MYSYMPYESDELAESDEFAEYDESDESDEARRGRARFRSPVRTARPGSAVPPRPTPGFATRAELTATANRLDAKVGVNSKAIKTVEGRVSTLAGENAKLRADLTKAQSGISDVRNMAMLMPLLTTQSTRAVSGDVAGTGLKSGDKVVVDNGDSFSRVLPLLLFSGGLGGSGGSGGSGGMFGGDGGGGIALIALMMATQNRG